MWLAATIMDSIGPDSRERGSSKCHLSYVRKGLDLNFV